MIVSKPINQYNLTPEQLVFFAKGDREPIVDFIEHLIQISVNSKYAKDNFLEFRYLSVRDRGGMVMASKLHNAIWTTSAGDEIPISAMDDGQFNNTIHWLKKKKFELTLDTESDENRKERIRQFCDAWLDKFNIENKRRQKELEKSLKGKSLHDIFAPERIKAFMGISVPDECEVGCIFLHKYEDASGTGDSPPKYECSCSNSRNCPVVNPDVYVGAHHAQK